MLRQLNISNFKCFKKVSIELGNITLLSGTNSSGKSSAIQALLLLENATANPSSQLNGDWLNLGSFDEVRNFITREDFFSIEVLSGDNSKSTFTYKETEIDNPSTDFVSLTPFPKATKIYYLSAHRVGPQNSYSKNFDSKNIIGKNGEFLIDLLNQNKSFNVEENRIASEDSHTLEFQVNYWLKKILNIKLEVQDLGITNLVSASYSFNDNKMVRPYHIGAGISYIIGIRILGVFIKKESILIVENPEIHLHPKAQSDLTDFFCFIANAGVQVIIESHSDHIFNGIRKSISKKTISNEDAKIHFFNINEENLSVNNLIKLSDRGKILDYQEGLFDQFDNDIDELLGL
jgi:predicted ATPase